MQSGMDSLIQTWSWLGGLCQHLKKNERDNILKKWM